MLAEAAWEGAPLGNIIVHELAAFAKQLSISGCDLFVNAPTAQQFALIIHELATNAVKYGALSASEGRVFIEGRIERVNGEHVFAMLWNESGGPQVRKPKRKGFGSIILLDGAKKFGRHAALDFQLEGIRYEIRMPLSTVEAVKASDDDRAAALSFIQGSGLNSPSKPFV
jgi:two-component sensor histidine kinase